MKNKRLEYQKQWLQARKELLQHIKAQVQYRFGPVDATVKKYETQFQKEFRSHWKETNNAELDKAISSSEIVLGADFHAFSQSQRAHLRVIRNHAKNKNMVLCLECLEPKDNEKIRQFLSGDLSENDFLEAVDWEGQWGFPWEYYKPLFALARALRIPVFGVNKVYKKRNQSNLRKRDRFSAQQLKKISKEHPGKILYVIFGEYHLALPHLPQEILEVFEEKPVITRIFQDSEKLYFKMAEEGRARKVDIMKRSKNVFCLLNSPPWVKWQSYQMFLDEYVDLDIDEDGEEVEYSDYVATLIRLVSKDLGLKVKVDSLEVYSSFQDESWRLFSKKFSSAERLWVENQIKNDRSFKLPKSQSLYLSSPTINHASSLAGVYIHWALSGAHVKIPKATDSLEPLIWQEACGFFVSKMINHKRKADTLATIQSRLAISSSTGKGKEAFVIALNQRFKEVSFCLGKKQSVVLGGKSTDVVSFFEAAKILGSMLGETIHKRFVNGKLSVKQIRSILKEDVAHSGFPDRYYNWIKKFDLKEL